MFIEVSLPGWALGSSRCHSQRKRPQHRATETAVGSEIAHKCLVVARFPAWAGLLIVSVHIMSGCQAGSGESSAQTADQEVTEFPRIGLRFTVPEGFMVGRFAPDSMPPEAAEAGIESPWKNAVVLAEPDQLSGFPIDAIPLGEIPVVWVDRPASTTSVLGRVIETDSTFEISAGTVFRYPGFPGPYGDQAFYFVVKLGDKDYAEVAAHRFLFRTTDMEPSHYDEAILLILGSLEVID